MATPRFFPFTGGVENHVLQVGSRLARQGVDVTVLTTDPSGTWPAEEEIEGIRVRRVRAWPRRLDLYLAPGIAQLVREGDFDLVHVQSYHTSVPFYAMRAARQAGIPYVLTFHGGGHSSPLRHAIRPLQRALLRPLLADAARLVALAEFEVREYGRQMGFPPEKFVMIPNGADLPRVPAAPPAAQDGTLILAVGRLERYKGHQRAVAALPHLLKLQPDARLRIVGGGPYEGDLRALAARLGVAERVEIGAIPPDRRGEMAALMQSAALMVLLSDFETHPLAALEALSLGRPVLVADNSGMSELAARGWVTAVPTHASPQEIAAAMFAQLQSPLVPPSIDLPTWDDCAAQLLGLYRELTRSKIHERQSN